MRIRQIEFEGAKGWAMVARHGRQVAAEVMLNGGHHIEMAADAGDIDDVCRLAARIFKELEGHAGTAGDVAGVLRAIETFAD